MPLSVGARLGPYEVIDALGSGGMGEMYRARDSRLARDVAVKILPAHFAADPERLARFEREARVLASLNHPHIAAIYGVENAPSAGTASAPPALILELVEGPTLAERLRRGALPLGEAVMIAVQIADALEAAHEKGIVHRDLKPANIKLTPAGAAKVLDFGIAKMRDASETVDAEQSTGTMVGTRAGIVLGTAAYMSPEQARGQHVDKRADIWAFGCVLYEMLTARVAFAGDTGSDTLARVLEREPDWTRLPERTPPGIRRLLRHCLEKDSKRRLRDIGDARLELEDPVPASSEPGATAQRRAIWASLAIGLGVATLVLGGIAWWSFTRPAAVPREDIVRFTIPFSAGEAFAIEGVTPPGLAISDDGEQFVYVSRRSDGDRLYLRRRRDSVPAPLAGTEGAIGPFFSPDGQWIGFASGGALKKIPIAGGAAQTLAEAPNLRGASWGPDDTIIYSPEWRGPLFTVSAQGGAPGPLTTLKGEELELAHEAPHVLPNGKGAFLAVGKGEPVGPGQTTHIELLEFATGQRRLLVEGRNPFYVSSGHVVFARANAVFVAPFDADRLELTGPASRVLDGVRTASQDTLFAVSRHGTLAYVLSDAPASRGLVRVDRQGGRNRPLTDQRAAFSHPRISPDGNRVVVQAAGEFWIHDVASGRGTRLRARGSRPIWMPDGQSILFQAQGQLYSAPVDDSREPQLVLAPKQGFLFPLAWSRDGGVLVYSNPVPGTGRDVWMLSVGGEPAPFLTTPRDERAAMFSPDGRWVVYAAKEVGREEEVYVQPYPGPGTRVVVSRGGGIEPVWSPTGGEIFYRSVDGRRMMAVTIQTQPSVSVGTPQVVLEGSYLLGTSYWSDYDVWPGGNEFLMVEADESAPPGLHVVLNWMVEVRRQLADGSSLRMGTHTVLTSRQS